jgi:hypothetical protein
MTIRCSILGFFEAGPRHQKVLGDTRLYRTATFLPEASRLGALGSSDQGHKRPRHEDMQQKRRGRRAFRTFLAHLRGPSGLLRPP